MARGQRKAFSLVEVLLVIIIGSLVAGAAVTLLYGYTKNFEQSTEYTKAVQRSQMALTVLGPAVLNSGIGMPDDEDGFSHFRSKIINPHMQHMTKPLLIQDGPEGEKNGYIHVFYAIPFEKAAAKGVEDISKPFSLEVFPSDGSTAGKLKNLLNPSYGGVDGKDKWVVMPTAGIPLRTVSVRDSFTIDFEGSPGSTSGRISPGDRLYNLRYLEAYVKNTKNTDLPALYVSDNSSSATPQVLGVRRVYFEWVDDRKVLRAWILGQGDVKFDRPLNQHVDWPAKSGYTLTDQDRQYYLAVSRADWRVRN